MSTLTDPSPTAEPAIFIPKRAQARDPWSIISAVLWRIPVVAAGMLIGAILAGILGLFLGWLQIAC